MSTEITITSTTIDINVTESPITIEAPSGAYPLPNAVDSVFGRTGNVVATEGDYTLTQLAGVTITSPVSGQALVYNGTSWVNNTETYAGTVTSVAATVPTGLTITGSPITTSGTLAFGLQTGYSIPTTASQGTWDTAYNRSLTSAAVTGTTTKTLTLNQQSGGTITASWTDDNTDAVTSVFGRTGAVVAVNGDYTTSLVTEGTNLYYTDVRARAAITGTSPISVTSGVVAISQSNTTTNGYISFTDWNTFNGKQTALNGTGFVKISGTTISYDNSTYLTTIEGITAGGELSGTYASPSLVNSAVTGKILTGVNVTGGSISATDSILTAFGKVQNQINGLIGGSIYQGTWNANTNTPTLTSSVGTSGYYYIVSVAGTTNLNGITDWQVGDWAIFNGGVWQKVDNTDAVVSVNGFTGAVSLTTSDISEGSNLYFTNARTIASTLTSYTSGAGTITSSDTILTAIQKLNGNISSIVSGVSSVFGRTGAVVATEGDYTLTQLGDVTITTPANGQVLKYNGTTWVNGTDTDTGLTSVGLSMPSAFTVTNSPLTANGTLSVTGAGIASQYVRGDGTLANFPISGGGGSSVAYYFNSSVSQGTLGGVAYRELSKVPIIGAGTHITIATNGYIANYITDAGDPALLEIPVGNWNFEMYFSASSGGGSPSFYVELYKYDGTTFTLISSSSATPESITGGTAIDLYFTALAVPLTTLTLTDRLAIRVYVNNSGRTITLHTENSHLCEVITTFTTGLTALNGLTAQVQFLTTGTSGTDFNISSGTATHTFNLPVASALNTGKLSSSDWSVFNNKQTALSGTGFVKISGTTISYDNSTYYLASNPSAFIALTALSAGTGISYNNTTGVITNSAPDQTVSLTSGAGISVSGTYPSFTIASTITQYTDALARASISLTTIGTSGAATYSSATGVLNIPQYSGGSGMVYPSAGIALSTGTAWGTSITDNSADWNTAYTNRITSATSPLSITTNVISIAQASTSVSGYLSSTDFTTFNNKQGAITLTTTGTSGAATLVGTTLNIPQYSGGGMAIGGSITSATAGSVLYAGASGVLAQSNANFYYDYTNNRLALGTTTVGSKLQVNGNAAIGYSASTAAPTNGLLVSGQAIFGSSTSAVPNTFTLVGQSGTNYIQVLQDSTKTYGLTYEISGSTFLIFGDYYSGLIAPALIFGTYPYKTNQLVLASTGFVGFGTTTIGSKIQVNGNAAIGYSASTAAPTNGLAVSGSVGIGTTTPVNLLQISNSANQTDLVGNLQINYTGTVSTASSGLTVKNYGGTSQFMQWEANGLRIGSRVLTNSGQGNISFTYGSDNEGMRLNSSGNLGIATTTIGSRLQVNGNAAIGYSASTAAPTNGLSVSGNLAVGLTTTTAAQVDILSSNTVLQAIGSGLGTTTFVLKNTNASFSNSLFYGVTTATGSTAYKLLDLRNNNGSTEVFKVFGNGATEIASSVTSTQYRLSALNTAPATSTSTGTLGEIRIDAGAIYVCTATNTWVRALLTTF